MLEITKFQPEEIDEAIKEINRLAAYEDTGLTPEEIVALVPTPNAPLTLEELREMDGDPVWVCLPDGSHGGWMINYQGWCTNRFASTERYGTYGKSWLAYRRRPEEGTV